MTAQGIEARSDKTRSGLAEGESPVRQDAPNPLYQEGYSMTDTTDQQAVTVAQIDRDLAASCARALGDLNVQHIIDGVEDETAIVQLIARHRLTTAPASSSLDRFIDAIHKATPNGECILVQHHPNGDWSVLRTPEPIPATNQAGEVERLRAALSNAATALEAADRARGIPSAGAAAVDALAALATQPATSQEGEKTIEILRRALAWHGDMQRMATTREHWQQTVDEAIIWVKANPEPGYLSFSSFDFAATPTPPTLSEDLREAIEDVAATLDHVPFNDIARGRAIVEKTASDLRAALAQVKAS